MKASDILGLPYQPGEADKLELNHKWWLVSGENMKPVANQQYWQCPYGCCTAGVPVSAGPFDTEEDALYLGHKIEIAFRVPPPGGARSDALNKIKEDYDITAYKQYILTKHGFRAIRGVDV